MQFNKLHVQKCEDVVFEVHQYTFIHVGSHGRSRHLISLLSSTNEIFGLCADNDFRTTTFFLKDTSPNYKLKITAGIQMHDMLSDAKLQLSLIKSTRSNLDKILPIVTSLQEIAEPIGELVPPLKPAVGLFKVAVQHVKDQRGCDELLFDLVSHMGQILPWLVNESNEKQVALQKRTTWEMLDLIGDAALFVTEYKGKNMAVQILKSFVFESAIEQVKEMKKKFDALLGTYKLEPDVSSVTQC